MNHLQHMGSAGVPGGSIGSNFVPSAQHQPPAVLAGVMTSSAAPASSVGVTIRLHGLPLTASSADIRKFFSGS